MRTVALVTSFAALATLSACNRPEPGKAAPSAMSSADLASEFERCKKLGLKVYDDAACQAAQKERNDRFFKKKEPEK